MNYVYITPTIDNVVVRKMVVNCDEGKDDKSHDVDASDLVVVGGGDVEEAEDVVLLTFPLQQELSHRAAPLVKRLDIT